MMLYKEKTKLFRCFNFDINVFHISVLSLGFSGSSGGGGGGGFRGGLGGFSLGRAGHLHGGQVLDGLTVALLDLLKLGNLSVSDVVEDGLEGLGFQHHVLDEVNVEVIEVHLADGVGKLVLELIDLVLQSPHLSDCPLDNFTKV